jgi:hypothetical protein
MKETGDEKPESPGSSDDSVEVRPGGGMQEADDESEELEARKDVRADVALEVVNTVSDVGAAFSPAVRDAFENREHFKIQWDRWKAFGERKFGRKSEE